MYLLITLHTALPATLEFHRLLCMGAPAVCLPEFHPLPLSIHDTDAGYPIWNNSTPTVHFASCQECPASINLIGLLLAYVQFIAFAHLVPLNLLISDSSVYSVRQGRQIQI